MKIVRFNAFDKVSHHVFVNNETPEQMHAVLKNICYTYLPIEILQVTGVQLAHPQQLETLKNLSQI